MINTNNRDFFAEKIKVGPHNHNFSAAMHGWEVYPVTKNAACRKEKYL